MSQPHAIPASPPRSLVRKLLKVLAWILLLLVIAFVGLFAVALVVNLVNGDDRKQVQEGTECHHAGSGDGRMRVCTTIKDGTSTTHITADPEP